MSKGGTKSGSTEIPAWLENAAIENINKARDVSQIGYVPYYGPDVAAFSPMQQQSMQSTGNAASAFGLAPQGFDAMAGMPQAETFEGGLQGYSSAPLYEQSLNNLFANAPGQYRAMNDMFIDPFTGARPQGSYAASPQQIDQMFDRSPVGQPNYDFSINNTSGGGAGGSGGGSAYDAIYHQAGSGDMTSGDTFVGDNGNTYTVGYGEGQVDHGLANAAANNNGYNSLMSNSDASAGIAGNLLDSSIFGKIYEGLTGNPLAGGSPDAIVSELSNDNALGYHSDGSAVSSPYDFGPSYDDGAALKNDYEAPQPLTLAEQYALYGGGQGFSKATTPAVEMEPVATTSLYPASNITAGLSNGYGLMSSVVPAKALISVDAEYDLQTALRDEEIRNEKDAAQAKAVAQTKAKRDAQAKIAAAEKAQAAKVLADKIAKDKVDAAETARKQVQAQLAAEAKAADKLAAAKALADKQAKDKADVKAAQAKVEAEAATKAEKDKAIEAETKRMLEESALISAEIKRKADAKKKSKSSNKRPQKTVTKPKSNSYSGQSAKKSTQGKAKTGYSFGL